MDVNNSLVRTISDNGAKDILSDMGEITLDNIINNEALNQIPIIGTLRNVYKIANSVSDYLFIQKLLQFLKELGNVSYSEREKVRIKIEEEERFGYKVGLHLLEIINKIDDSEKPVVIAKLFKAYIEEKIDIQKFFKYSSIINKSFLPDLKKLNEISNGQTISIEDSSSLLGLGLLEVKTKTQMNNISLGSIGGNNQIEFKLNGIGKELHELMK